MFMKKLTGERQPVCKLIGDKDRERWIKKLQKLIKEAPDDVWIFAASGTLNVMLKKEGVMQYNKKRLR